jgi:hypothetical protein
VSAHALDERGPADHLLTLARRSLRFPHMDVSDEVALVSTVPDREVREITFDELCTAVHDADAAGIETALNVLTGGAS